jgi:hypothetical protein
LIPDGWIIRRGQRSTGKLDVETGEEITESYDIVNEIKALNLKHYKVKYDARMVLNGRVYLLEVDRGSEDLEQLTHKIRKYVAFADSLPSESFQVVFTLQKYRRMHFGNRADAVIDLLARQKRRNMFVVARHSDVLADPLGPVFVSPLDPTKKQHLSELT